MNCEIKSTEATGAGNSNETADTDFWSISIFRIFTSSLQQPLESSVCIPHRLQISVSVAKSRVESSLFMQ